MHPVVDRGMGDDNKSLGFQLLQLNLSLNTSDEADITSYYDDIDSSNHSLSVDKLLMIYVLPVIVLAGTIGNLASAIVLFRSRMRVVSVYMYLFLLALADTGVLYASAFKTWFRLVAGVEWLHVSDVACRTLTFLFLASLHLSAWLVVMTTADRFVAVWFPLKTATFCSHERARLAASLLLLATVLFDGHLFWTVKLQYLESAEGNASSVEPFCRPDPSVDYFMYGPFEYLKLATYNVIPFITIMTLNAAIIARLRWATPLLHDERLGQRPHPGQGHSFSGHCDIVTCMTCCCCCFCSSKKTSEENTVSTNNVTADGKQTEMTLQYSPRPISEMESSCDNGWMASSSIRSNHKNRHRSETGDDAYNASKSRSDESGAGHANSHNSRVTTMLLTVSIVWLVLTTPFTICGFLFTVADLSYETAQLLMPFKAVSFLLMYTNHAINFYLYCLTGRKFRRELVDMIMTVREWCCGRRRTSACRNCVNRSTADRGGNRGRSNTIELVLRTDIGSRLVSGRKSDV